MLLIKYYTFIVTIYMFWKIHSAHSAKKKNQFGCEECYLNNMGYPKKNSYESKHYEIIDNNLKKIKDWH